MSNTPEQLDALMAQLRTRAPDLIAWDDEASIAEIHRTAIKTDQDAADCAAAFTSRGAICLRVDGRLSVWSLATAFIGLDLTGPDPKSIVLR